MRGEVLGFRAAIPLPNAAGLRDARPARPRPIGGVPLPEGGVPVAGGGVTVPGGVSVNRE